MLLINKPSMRLAFAIVASTWSANVSRVSRMTPRSRMCTHRSRQCPSNMYERCSGDVRRVNVIVLHLAGLSFKRHVFDHMLSRLRSF